MKLDVREVYVAQFIVQLIGSLKIFFYSTHIMLVFGENGKCLIVVFSYYFSNCRRLLILYIMLVALMELIVFLFKMCRDPWVKK